MSSTELELDGNMACQLLGIADSFSSPRMSKFTSRLGYATACLEQLFELRIARAHGLLTYDITSVSTYSELEGWGDWWLLDRTSMETFGEILDIVNGGEAVTELDGAMTYGDIGHDMRSLYSLMVMSGYLKAVPCENGFYRVSIPNEEVMGMVERMIDSCSPIDDGIFREFNIAVRDKDCVTMTEKLQSILSDASYLILRDEYDYQMVLLTMMHSMSRIYSIKTEYEAGNGRLDIILMPKRDGIDPMIFELKKVKGEDMLDRSAEEALVQIHDRRYHNGMSGEVVLFGISFWGKFPKVVTETIQV